MYLDERSDEHPYERRPGAEEERCSEDSAGVVIVVDQQPYRVAEAAHNAVQHVQTDEQVHLRLPDAPAKHVYC